MLCAADSIGVFQVESRAQIGTLPRLRPRCFYDLVVEVALIRPGPIQGGSVHPYIRRRNGDEPITYLHPLLKNSLAKTLGIPLFQEQLMQIAIDVAGFTPAEADQLRQAIGAKRSERRMAALSARFLRGAAERGVGPEIGEQIWAKLSAFANYGFPESHSVSFAYIVYASAWLKYHYPAAFCAGLLDAQPMGFYSSHSLIQDAKRHGVAVATPSINRSNWCSALQWDPNGPGWTRPINSRLHANPAIPQPTLRLGIGEVRGIGENLAKELASGQPWESAEDLVRRGGLNRSQMEALATAGALGDLLDTPITEAAIAGVSSAAAGVSSQRRREDLWTAGAAAQSAEGKGGALRLPGIVTGTRAPKLPGMEDWELAQADLWATGIAPDGHPTRFVRHRLAAKGVVTTAHLHELPDRSRVSVGGVVTHRQRPATAGGITFMNLEDETGFANVVVSEGCWKRYQQIARSATMVVVRGRLERSREGVVNLIADRMDSVADLVIGGSAAEGGKSGEPEGERVGSPWPERPAAEGGKSGEPEGERVGSPWPERPAAEGGKSGQQQPQQAADRYLSVSPLSATTSLRSRDFR
jgi:error-prone DNA polymerase